MPIPRVPIQLAHLSAGGVDLVNIGVGSQVAGQGLQQHRLADDGLVVFSAVLPVPAQFAARPSAGVPFCTLTSGPQALVFSSQPLLHSPMDLFQACEQA